MKIYLGLALIIVFLVSCKHPSDDYKIVFNDPLLYCKTVKRLNDVVMENNFPPIVACRNYTYANIAAYECIVAGDSSYISLAGQLKGLTRLLTFTWLPCWRSLNLKMLLLFRREV